jgi:UPF0755 protein
VISDPILFELYAYLNRSKGPLKAGEFLFKANTNIGRSDRHPYPGQGDPPSLTIPEGLTSEQIVQRLRENDVLTGDLNDISARRLAPCRTPTSSSAGTTRQQVVNQMQSASAGARAGLGEALA